MRMNSPSGSFLMLEFFGRQTHPLSLISESIISHLIPNTSYVAFSLLVCMLFKDNIRSSDPAKWCSNNSTDNCFKSLVLSSPPARLLIVPNIMLNCEPVNFTDGDISRKVVLFYINMSDFCNESTNRPYHCLVWRMASEFPYRNSTTDSSSPPRLRPFPCPTPNPILKEVPWNWYPLFGFEPSTCEMSTGLLEFAFTANG